MNPKQMGQDPLSMLNMGDANQQMPQMPSINGADNPGLDVVGDQKSVDTERNPVMEQAMDVLDRGMSALSESPDPKRSIQDIIDSLKAIAGDSEEKTEPQVASNGNAGMGGIMGAIGM